MLNLHAQYNQEQKCPTKNQSELNCSYLSRIKNHSLSYSNSQDFSFLTPVFISYKIPCKLGNLPAFRMVSFAKSLGGVICFHVCPPVDLPTFQISAIIALITCCSYFSVIKSCSTLCSLVNCSMPGFPALHFLPEFAQTHILWVSDAIQPSHSLSPSPPALSIFQHQGLFHWVGSSHQMAKVLELQLQHQSFQWIFRVDFLLASVPFLKCLFLEFMCQYLQ